MTVIHLLNVMYNSFLMQMKIKLSCEVFSIVATVSLRAGTYTETKRDENLILICFNSTLFANSDSRETCRWILSFLRLNHFI